LSLIRPGSDLRVGAGTFPIPACAAAPHAGAMDTTTAYTAPTPDDHAARDQEPRDQEQARGPHEPSPHEPGPHHQGPHDQGPHDQGSFGRDSREQASGTYGSGPPDWQQALRRPVHDRMLAGVASGVARYLGVDAAIVRIVLVVLTFAGGAGLPLYLAGWLLIPEEGTGQSIASDFLARPGQSR
jgi:phage shock protein PspC (stress-responsive transcriptional regulator)